MINHPDFHLDKDILIKGNKLYSSETCCLVPPNVNYLFTKRNALRGDTPIGVSKDYRKSGNFVSICSNPYGKDYVHYGFTNPDEAFYQYKKDKEMVIQTVANIEYAKGSISEKCYNAMMNYQVEITD